ncbi:hypothetical protein KIPB_009609, partial [Kipferlia bialata]
RPMHRPHLVAFAGQLAECGYGMLSVGDVVYAGDGPIRSREWPEAVTSRYIKDRDVTGFLLAAHPVSSHATYKCTIGASLREGVRSLLTADGIGMIRPNTVLLGFKDDWRQNDCSCEEESMGLYRDAVVGTRHQFDLPTTPEEGDVAEGSFDEGTTFAAREFIGILRDAAALGMGIVIPRRLETLYSTAPVSDTMFITRQQEPSEGAVETAPVPVLRRPPTIPVRKAEPSLSAAVCANRCRRRLRKALNTTGSEPIRYPDASTNPAKGRIDLLWLADDGGMCVLLPYLLGQHPAFKNCSLRVMTTSTPGHAKDASRVEGLLHKFRIEAEVSTIDHQALLDPVVLAETMRLAQLHGSPAPGKDSEANAVFRVQGLPENGSMTQVPFYEDEAADTDYAAAPGAQSNQSGLLSLFAGDAPATTEDEPTAEGTVEGTFADSEPAVATKTISFQIPTVLENTTAFGEDVPIPA